MKICQKCGRIFFETEESCDVCKSSDLVESKEITLIDYECQNCKSMFRNRIELCPNCGSSQINKKSSERKIISDSHLVDSIIPFDISRFEKLNSQLEMMNNACDVFRFIFGIFLIIGSMLTVKMINDNSFILSILCIIMLFFCFFTALASIEKPTINWTFLVRIGWYIFSFIMSFFIKDRTATYAIFFTLLLYIIVTFMKKIVPKLIKTNADELAKVRNKHTELIKNGILFTNLDYELVPAGKDQYCLRVVINNPSGIVMAFTSEEKYSKIDFETVNLLLDLHDYSNYYIYSTKARNGEIQ